MTPTIDDTATYPYLCGDCGDLAHVTMPQIREHRGGHDTAELRERFAHQEQTRRGAVQEIAAEL